MQRASLQFSTADVAPSRRLTYWREKVDERFLALEISPAGGQLAASRFSGSASIRELGELRIAHVRANPLRARRTCHQIERSREQDYLVGLHLSGRAHAAQGGRCITLRPGDLALFDSSRPYAIDFCGAGGFEHLVYQIPRLALEARYPRVGHATSIRVSLDSDEGRVVAPCLRAIARAPASILPASAERLSSSALDLLATALAAASGDHPEPAAAGRGLLDSLKQCALSRLGDPRLSPAEVARARFISVRQLHRLFAREDTTFGAFVREQRLRRCRSDLADPAMRELTIAELARRSGFTSAPHFTRAFAARFGVAPRDFRASTGGWAQDPRHRSADDRRSGEPGDRTDRAC